MKAILVTKEQALKIFEMRYDGFTYEKIGEEFGVSKQCVEQFLINTIRGTRCFSKYTHYKNLIEWMMLNGFSPTSFAKHIGMTPYILRDRLKEGSAFSQKELIKICKRTGFSLDELVEGENDD